MFTYAYGFPRLGAHREFKKLTEDFWKGDISRIQYMSGLDILDKQRHKEYSARVDVFPCGEMTRFDKMLDTALSIGLYKAQSLEEYFAFARGVNALELKKFFNTNYHYLVPTVTKSFKPSPHVACLTLCQAEYSTNPLHLIAPYTFTRLSRLEGISFPSAFEMICDAYGALLGHLKESGVKAVHLEDPALTLDASPSEKALVAKLYAPLLDCGLDFNLITYYEAADNLPLLLKLPVKGLVLDFVAGAEENIAALEKHGFPGDKTLICGVVDGRNVARSDIPAKARLVKRIMRAAGLEPENIGLSNAAPLFHLPVTLGAETGLDKDIASKLAFARERLLELELLKNYIEGDKPSALSYSSTAPKAFRATKSPSGELKSLSAAEMQRRARLHAAKFQLPLFPITGIGSFPQDDALRAVRRNRVLGMATAPEYARAVRERIARAIKLQEDNGFDVLVHGEFERSDMVEFFAQRLAGFSASREGFIISYGTRVYRPPIVTGRIKRSSPMTLEETLYAQSLTPRPVKGIFTGPVTMLAWSFSLRHDEPRAAMEVARALNGEARALYAKGIRFIQIDEPAIKEHAPLRECRQKEYFHWAVRAFNTAAALPRDAQIHTHVCYSEFGDIMPWLKRMNFDVISMETARDKGKTLDAFGRDFGRAVGPGMWDIHSRFPADLKTALAVLTRAADLFGRENVWVNPDCGLKTRDWPELEASFSVMRRAAEVMRKLKEAAGY